MIIHNIIFQYKIYTNFDIYYVNQVLVYADFLHKSYLYYKVFLLSV